MNVFVFGFKSHNVNAEPIPVYAGTSGEAAQKAINAAPADVIRFGKLISPVLLPAFRTIEPIAQSQTKKKSS